MSDWLIKGTMSDDSFTVSIEQAETREFSWASHESFRHGRRHFTALPPTMKAEHGRATHLIMVEGGKFSNVPMMFMDEPIHGEWIMLAWREAVGPFYLHCADCAAAFGHWVVTNQEEWWRNFYVAHAPTRLYQ